MKNTFTLSTLFILFTYLGVSANRINAQSISGHGHKSVFLCTDGVVQATGQNGGLGRWNYDKQEQPGFGNWIIRNYGGSCWWRSFHFLKK